MQQATNYFRQLTYKLFPDLKNQPPAMQEMAQLGMIYFYFLIPFFVAGNIWLWRVTDWSILVENWGILLFLLLLISQLDQRPFILPISLTERITLPFSTSLSNLLSMALLLIYGPSALWVNWIAGLTFAVHTGLQSSRQRSIPYISALSSFIQSSGSGVFLLLVTGTVYTATGGQFPFQANSFTDWLPAVWAIVALAFMPLIVYFLPTWGVAILTEQPLNRQTLFQLLGGVTLLTVVSVPFALPLALVYDAQNLTLFVSFCLAVALTNMLAYFLSQFNMLTQIRSKELRRLETLGQELITAPADGSTLEDILAQHLPQLFPNAHLVVRLFADFPHEQKISWPTFTLQTSTAWPPVTDTLWQQIRESTETSLVERKVTLPGDKVPSGDRFLVKIIIAGEDETLHCVGAIYLQRLPSDRVPNQVLPTLQELASQIGSALYRAQTHQETLQRQKMTQELAFAGRIQQSFLPNEIPQHPSWDFDAALIPARQTSGDFYDFVPLGNGRLGLVVADVADKGTGAALYMALSRTLIRTYAMQFPDEPGKALQLANERILLDTETDQFVTVFYGVLELENGRFTYANAGHNPTYHLGTTIKRLTKTGIPLGMFEEMVWQQETIQIRVGESLILYSDGVPEAQNDQQEEFGEERMLAIAQQKANGSATVQQTAIADAVNQFVGDAPQFDDITLMVVTRVK